jgi:acetylglutamate kinase
MDRVTNLKQALPYIRKHRGKTFVIKLGGRVMENREALLAIAEDITLLHSVGIHVVLVHGGGPQVDTMADRLGVPQQRVAGRRITDEPTLDIAKMMFRGKLNIELVSVLRECGTLSVGLSGSDGGLIDAVRRPIVQVEADDGSGLQSVDFGHVGDITRVEPSVLRTLSSAGYVPVVCSLASTPTGGVLNVNADTIAQKIAISLGAAKLFFLTDQPGLLRNASDPTSIISYTDRPEIERFVKEGIVRGGMKPKVKAALDALAQGVGRVHMISAFQPAALLLEVFTNEGCGTLIVNDRYEVEG